MNHHPHPVIELSFADAIGLINKADLTPPRKAEWACSLRMIAEGLGCPLEGLVARWQVVAPRVKKLHAARCGMNPRTLANHKSRAKRALLYLTEKTGMPGRGAALTPEWAALRALVPNEHEQYMLTALMRHASALGVAPGAIDDAFVGAYIDYRRTVLGQDARPVIHRNIVKAWNKAVARHAAWPRRVLTPIPTRDRGVIPWEAFPMSLRGEIDAWLEGQKKTRRLKDGSRRKPAKDTTLRTRLAEVQAFTRRAVALGAPIEELSSLRVLLDPARVEQVIDQMCGDADPRTSVVDLGARLHALASATGCLDPEDLSRLRDIRDMLEDQRPEGMTEKNLKVVRAVMMGDIWNEIVALPAALIDRAMADRKSSPVRAALRAQRAIGIAILTFMPIRIGNLARIRVGTHLVRPEGLVGDYLLTIPAAEVKNNAEIEAAFDTELTGLIDCYIQYFRPTLMDGANHDFLFPGQMGNPRAIASFGERIAETVDRAIGIRITAHQFRHAAAAFILRRDPGNYEFVRRILGHKSTKTTHDYYIALEGIAAGRHFAEMLRGKPL